MPARRQGWMDMLTRDPTPAGNGLTFKEAGC
jgi:hypothetical protein